MKIIIVLVIVTITFLLSANRAYAESKDSIELAHGGGTDKCGCHYKKSTGKYHCHTRKKRGGDCPA